MTGDLPWCIYIQKHYSRTRPCTYLKKVKTFAKKYSNMPKSSKVEWEKPWFWIKRKFCRYQKASFDILTILVTLSHCNWSPGGKLQLILSSGRAEPAADATRLALRIEKSIFLSLKVFSLASDKRTLSSWKVGRVIIGLVVENRC